MKNRKERKEERKETKKEEVEEEDEEEAEEDEAHEVSDDAVSLKLQVTSSSFVLDARANANDANAEFATQKHFPAKPF